MKDNELSIESIRLVDEWIMMIHSISLTYFFDTHSSGEGLAQLLLTRF
jgi:hypothetical protein